MQLEGKTILVTGGAGFIGSHLVDALTERRGCKIRVLDNLSTGRRANLAHHLHTDTIEFVQADLLDPAAVKQALDGVHIVFHLACRGVRHSIGQPLTNHEVNAGGTLLLLAEALKARVARFVHVSTSEVYGSARSVPMTEDHPCFPETVYGAAKLAGECYARAYHQTYGLATVVVRPFNNFGPRSHHEGDSGEVIPRFAVWALNGRPPLIFGDGKQTRDFIYVADTAFWLGRVAECDDLVGQTINLGSGQETSIRELARLVYQAVGSAEIPPVFQPSRPGDVRRHLAGVDRIQKLLGFRANITLAQGIDKLIQYLRAQHPQASALLEQIDNVNWTKAA